MTIANRRPPLSAMTPSTPPVSSNTGAAPGDLIALLKRNRVISVMSAPSMRLGDPRALLLLSQMSYWTVRDSSVVKAQGWLSRPAANWMEETLLTRSHLSSAVETLRNLGVLKTWQEGRKVPWWKLDLQRLYTLCHGNPPSSEVPLARYCADQAYRERITGKPLLYYTALANITGDALLGLFLSRCCHWHASLETRNRLKDRHAWGWPSRDWFADIGITRSQLRTAMAEASRLGFISITEIGRPFPGIFLDRAATERAYKAKFMPNEGVVLGTVHTVSQTATPWPFLHKCAHPNNAPEDGKASEGVHVVSHYGTPYQNVSERGRSTDPENVHTLVQTASDWLFVPMCGQPQGDSKASPNAGFDQPDRPSNAENGQAFAGFSQTIAGFSQSTRACGFDYSDYSETTTTTISNGVYCAPVVPPVPQVVVVPDQRGQLPSPSPEPLIFPSGLDASDAALLGAALSPALPNRRQALLDELAGRLANTALPAVSNPVGYLRRLVRDDVQANGSLTLDYAHKVLVARLAKRAADERLSAARAAVERIPSSSASAQDARRAPRDFAQIKAILKGREPSTDSPAGDPA